jgi:hypothetical protein
MRWDELLAIAGLIVENQVIFHSLDRDLHDAEWARRSR